MTSIYRIRLRFLLLQWIAVAITLPLVYWVELQDSLKLLVAISLWVICSYSYLFYEELRRDEDFNPILIMILATIQYTGINGLSLYNDVQSGDVYNISFFRASDILSLGAVYLLLEHTLILTGYYYLLYKKRKEDRSRIIVNIKKSKINFLQFAIISYIFIILLRLIDHYIFSLALISSFLNSFKNYGYMVALLFVVFHKLKYRSAFANYVYWTIALLEMYLVLGTGMKEMILRPVLPYAIYLVIKYKIDKKHFSFSSFVGILVVFVFTLFFVFPYVSIFRQNAIHNKITWSEVSISNVFDEYLDYLSDSEEYERKYGLKGISYDYALSRAGSIGANSFAIAYVDKYNPDPQFIKDCFTAIIPRVVWWDKPLVLIGAKISNLVRHDSYSVDEESINSDTLGFIGACYFGLGIMGAIFIPLILGLFMGFIWVTIKKSLHSNVVSIWVFISLVVLFLKDFESLYDCGFTYILFNVVYLFLIWLIEKWPKKAVKTHI